jgi:hypothetical protein
MVGTAAAAAAAAEVQQGSATPLPPEPADDKRDWAEPKFKPQFKRPQLGRLLVQDFVIFGHGDLDMVKQLLEKYPAVLNATVDWGGGDFESALGGAAHMGRRDIAQFLLEKGARIDIFAAAMLGHLDVVKALIGARPYLADSKGPHGIPLIVHAKQGGKEAEEVLKYLEGLKRPAPP